MASNIKIAEEMFERFSLLKDKEKEILKNSLRKNIIVLEENLPLTKDLSLYETRLLLLILKFISKFKEAKNISQTIEIYNRFYYTLFGGSEIMAYENALNAVTDFYNRSIKTETRIGRNNRKLVFRIISAMQYSSEDGGKIEITLTKEFIELLFKVRDKLDLRYGKLFLGDIVGLSTASTLKLFTWLCIRAHEGYFAKVKSREVVVKENLNVLCDILGIEGKYRDWANLNYYVFKPAIGEICKNTSFIVELKKERGRENLTFFVKKKEHWANLFLDVFEAPYVFRNPEEVGIEEFEEDTSL